MRTLDIVLQYIVIVLACIASVVSFFTYFSVTPSFMRTMEARWKKGGNKEI